MRKNQFRTFKDAKTFVISLKFGGVNDWYKFCKDGKRPRDIPSCPDQVYKRSKEWNGWGDFLGTGNIAHFNKQYRTFNEARQFAQQLNLKNQAEWFAFCKSGKKPDDISSRPNGTYKNKGWKGWGDFLGTGNLAPQDRSHRSFEDARKFVHKLNLKNMNEFRSYCKSGKKPDDIPATPDRVYKNDGWISFGDWLGTGTIASQKITYRPFNEARKFIHSLKLKNVADWQKYAKSGNKPVDIPTSPSRIFANKGWKGFGDWLGTGTLSPLDKRRQMRSFSECQKFIRSLGITTETEWKTWLKSNTKPDDIPYDPRDTYEDEWKDWRDFLGDKPTKWKSFIDAREYVRNLKFKTMYDFHEYSKSGNRPNYIPSSPPYVYKKEWKGWSDFLGNGNISSLQKSQSKFSYDDARGYVQKLGFQTAKEFAKWAKTKQRPIYIPASPHISYKKEWKGWNEFLNTRKKGMHRSFEDARKFAHSLNLKFNSEWFSLHKQGKIPKDIPRYVNETYAEKGWKGWGDFLGTGNLSPKDVSRQYISNLRNAKIEARKIAKELGLRSEEDWMQAHRSGKIPKHLPRDPRRVYYLTKRKKK